MKLFLMLTTVSLSFPMNNSDDDYPHTPVVTDHDAQQLLPEIILPDIELQKAESIREPVSSPTRAKDDVINTSFEAGPDQLPKNVKVFSYNVDASGDGVLIFKLKDAPLKINELFLRQILHINPEIDFDHIALTSMVKTYGGVVSPFMFAEFQKTKTLKYRETIVCPEYGLNIDQVTFAWNEIACKNMIIAPLNPQCPIEKIIISPLNRDSIIIDGKIDFSKPIDDMIEQLKIIHGGMIALLKEDK